MLPTATIELTVPERTDAAEHEQIQRSMVHFLLTEGQITIAEALELLADEERAWLKDTLLQEAIDNLFLASQIVDIDWRGRFWKQYNFRLGFLFQWHEEWSTSHNELLTILRTVVRRYKLESLTSEQMNTLQTLTKRLHDKHLYQEDIFSATRALQELEIETLVDFAPVADRLSAEYESDLGRA